MTATRQTIHVIACDGDGCQARLSSGQLRLRPGATAADVREAARSRGWIAVNPGRYGTGQRWAYGQTRRLDFCPAHAADARRGHDSVPVDTRRGA